MISPLDVSVLDRNCEELGVDVSSLMEAAGKALAEEIGKRSPVKGKVVVVSGTGNNGGDGMVAARYLSTWGNGVEVIYVKPVSMIRSDIARKAYRDLPDNVAVTVLKGDDPKKQLRSSLKDASFIVDALLGAGSKGAPRGDIAMAVDEINRAKGFKVAVDSPTGLGYRNSVKADLTVTFHDLKEGMLKDGKHHENCGELVVRTIGIPVEASLYVGPGDLMRMPSKGKESKKGETGRVLIIGGGPFTGAPSLAAMAAVKAGADLVRVAVPRGIAKTIAGMSPDLIVERMDTLHPYELGPEVLLQLMGLLDWCHCMVIGPGSGRSKPALHLMVDLIRAARDRGKPVVIDADAITSVAGYWKQGETPLDPVRALITPHRGELERLVSKLVMGSDTSVLSEPYEGKGSSSRWKKEALELASTLQNATGGTLLVKGPVDLISSMSPPSLSNHVEIETGGGPLYRRYNLTGVPAMSVGGTGDVLCGICGGLMSRGMSGFDAACVASYVNGKAGESVFSEIGHSLSASSLIERLRFR